MKTIELKGNVYLIGKLDAMKQFHITRRLAPLLAAAGESASGLSNLANMKEDELFMKMAVSITDGLANMKNEEAEFVIGTCLDVVQRQISPEKAGPVRVAGRFMYEDIDMLTMLRLTSEVVQENCGDFFGQLIGALGLPISVGSPDAAAPATQPS